MWQFVRKNLRCVVFFFMLVAVKPVFLASIHSETAINKERAAAPSLTEELETREAIDGGFSAANSSNEEEGNITQNLTVNGVACVSSSQIRGRNDFEEMKRLMDLRTLSLFGCPFYYNQMVEVDDCAEKFEIVCGAAVFASPVRRNVNETLTDTSLRRWGGERLFTNWDLRNIYMLAWGKWEEWRSYGVYNAQSALQSFQVWYRPGKHVCDNILPLPTDPLPCERLPELSCSCPWSIFPEMCSYLLRPCDQNIRHDNVIKYGDACPDNWTSLKCRTFRDLRHDYVRRMTALGCPLVKNAEEDHDLCDKSTPRLRHWHFG